MKFSIITVSCNSEDTIADALESVWRQKRDELEIEYIAVDGASTDGTLDRLKQFDDKVRKTADDTFVFRWISEEDDGLYDAMNKGIRMATGDVVGIVNSDDMLNSDTVLADIAANIEDEGVVYCNVRIVPRNTKLCDLINVASIRYIWPRLWRPWMLSWGWTPPHPGLFIRRSAYERFGAYLTGYEISSDDEIIVRLVRRHRIKAKYLPICASAMRAGGKSQSGGIKTFIKQNQEFVEMNRSNGYYCCLPMMFPKLLIKALEIVVPKIMNVCGKRI